MPDDNEKNVDAREHMKRDSESLRILGGFLSLLASLVLLSSLFQEGGHAWWVNLGSGIALLAIGMGMFAWGLVLKSRLQ
jgi:uncharacterized membrane protein HdeD (DUF308 family)